MDRGVTFPEVVFLWVFSSDNFQPVFSTAGQDSEGGTAAEGTRRIANLTVGGTVEVSGCISKNNIHHSDSPSSINRCFMFSLYLRAGGGVLVERPH